MLGYLSSSLFIFLFFLTACSENTNDKEFAYAKAYEVPHYSNESPSVPGSNPIDEYIDFYIPETWKILDAKPMVVLSLKTPTSIVINISKFPGITGSETANIKRWQTQVGSPKNGEGPETKRLETNIGNGSFISLNGKENGILVFWLGLNGYSYFFKAEGKNQNLKLFREEFVVWLKQQKLH